MNKTLENIKKIRRLGCEETTNIFKTIWHFGCYTLFVLFFPAFTGLGFFYFTSIGRGSTSYLGSFVIAIGFSWLIEEHFNKDHLKPTQKLINRNKKIREEIKQCQKKIH